MYEYNLGIRFQNLAAQYPARTALWYGDQSNFSYRELNELSNRAARWLLDRDISAGDVICISGEKSVHTFVCMLACLKVGAVYAILDQDSPAERLRKIIDVCKPALLLAERSVLDKLEPIISPEGPATFEKDSDLAVASAGYNRENLHQTDDITGKNPAYVMFTSGSTGFPKGAVMTHDNVLNLISWSRETFRITPDDCLTNVNPMYFDNSVFDFYSALFNGARLAPLTKEEVRDPKILVEKIDAAGCTVWFSVPSLLIFLQTMKAADGNNLKSISRFIFGGEGYPKQKLKRLFEDYSGSSELFNVYGPTECTCICSCYKLSSGDFEDIHGVPPLGSIADNFAYMILDETGHKVSDGEAGELCLLGPNVGLGYLNDAQKTAASFVQNPYNPRHAEIMYKTGDMVRFDPADGKLYILGRRDNQIKHMGYRIELEEIDAALHCIDYVSEGVALHATVNGFSRLVGVVSSAHVFSDDDIRRELGLIIPGYMIPSVFYREEALPKNANGKIDRRLLAEKYLKPGL